MSGVFVGIVCPLIGNLLGVAMLLTPTPAVLQARRAQRLGALNVWPYPLTAINCAGWIAYGLVIPNLWIVPANVLGLCAGIWFTLVSLPLMDRKSQDRMVALVVGSAAFLSILSIIGMFGLSSEGRTKMWGMEALIVLLLYYGIPLSTMWEVIKTRNAASIYLPLAFAAIANGSMWTLYGLFAVHDFNVWMPNGVGVLLAIPQVVLRLRFGSKDVHAADSHLVPTQDSATLSETHSNPPVWRGLSDPRMALLAPHKNFSDDSLKHSFTHSPPTSTQHSVVELNPLHHDLRLLGHHRQDTIAVPRGVNGEGNGAVHIIDLSESSSTHMLADVPRGGLMGPHAGMHAVESSPAIVQHTANGL